MIAQLTGTVVSTGVNSAVIDVGGIGFLVACSHNTLSDISGKGGEKIKIYTHMVVREDANRIEVDEYNRWAMPPGAMLTKYLAARFAAQAENHLNRDGKPVFILDGSVLNCELNKTKKQVDLLVHFIIIEPGRDDFRITGTENCTVPAGEATPEAFADGMNKAAAKFADHVVAVLKEEIAKRADEAKAAPEKK